MSDNKHNTGSSSWRCSRSGTWEWSSYNDLTKEEWKRLNLGPENHFKTTDENYSYWGRVSDDHDDVSVYRSPIIAYITHTKPSNSQKHMVLSARDLELLKESASEGNLGPILEHFKQIEEAKPAPSWSKDEEKQRNKDETHSYGQYEPKEG
jgi:hypothetical protein